LVSFALVAILTHWRPLAKGRTVPLDVRCWLLSWKPVLEARRNYVGLVSSGRSAGLCLNVVFHPVTQHFIDVPRSSVLEIP